VVCTEEGRIITFCGIVWKRKRGPFFKGVKDLMDSFLAFNWSEEEDQIARLSAWNKLIPSGEGLQQP